MALIPGKHRLNLHASYADSNSAGVERNELQPKHFQGWIDWAQGERNRSRLQSDVFLSSEVGRRIYAFAPGQRNPPILDRARDLPVDKSLQRWERPWKIPALLTSGFPTDIRTRPIDRKGPRERLADSLDAIFADSIDPKFNQDAVECKLFGIGSESYVVGSHEFYLGYAVRNNKASVPRRGSLSSDRIHLRQDFLRASVDR